MCVCLCVCACCFFFARLTFSSPGLRADTRWSSRSLHPSSPCSRSTATPSSCPRPSSRPPSWSLTTASWATSPSRPTTLSLRPLNTPCNSSSPSSSFRYGSRQSVSRAAVWHAAVFKCMFLARLRECSVNNSVHCNYPRLCIYWSMIISATALLEDS